MGIDIGISTGDRATIAGRTRTARGIFPAVESAADEPTADVLTLRMQVHENNVRMLRSPLEVA